MDGCTIRHLGYPRCTGKNCWHSIDAHSQIGAVIMQFAIFPMNAANRVVMHISDQITIQLPYLEDQ